MFGSLDEILEDIEGAPDGPEVAAFFDFDNTLIAGYSVSAFLREQLLSGAMSPQEIGVQAAATARYSLGQLGFSGLVSETAKSLRGQAEYTFEEFSERVFKKHVAGAIYPEARDILEAHREKGHTIAIVSSATRYQIEPAARELEIDYILCTELEVEDGVFTGRVVRPTCWGDGKRTYAESFAKDFDIKMRESFFYTDSHEDLPLLEAVGRPRVLNPNSKLTRIGRQRSYPMFRFRSRGRPTIGQIARTGAVYSSMPSFLAATLPIWALTGRKRDMLNTTLGFWAEYSAAIAGIRINIEGEANLWEQRPAVFIFNHQSALDALIIAKLVKRDFTGIGKKEIASYPVLGQLFKFADVVFIDRKNTDSAIEAMKPVVDALQNDGLSVALAPEGTRSPARSLGRFKKGAFHIAMQAKAPIVPIIIHNAADSLPKGRRIARPADIDVTVLDPIDTSKWKAKDLDKHIDAVRDLFLETLGQEDHVETEFATAQA
ncbi:MAG: HAD-IB family hydrolase [Pseudomonadota bacterium]